MSKLLRFLITGYTIYVALALLIIFPLLNIMAPRYIQSQLNREFRAGIVVFNPFSVSVDVRDAQLHDPDGSLFVGWKKLSVNLSLSSLWSRELVFDAIELDSLRAEIVRTADGHFNFADLLPPPAPSEDIQPPVALPGLAIGRLAVHAQTIRFVDRAREPHFTSELQEMVFAVKDLSTRRDSVEPYSFRVLSEAGGELRVAGHISLPGSQSTGTLSLNNFSLGVVSRFAEPWVHFRLPSGLADVEGKYSIDWQKQLAYRVENGAIKLRELTITAKQPELIPDTSVSFDQMSLANIELDSAQQQLEVAELGVLGLEIRGWSEGERVSLAQLFTPVLNAEGTEDQATDDAPSPWSLAVANTDIPAASVRWRSQYTQPELLSLSPVDIRAGRLEWPASKPGELTVNIVLNESAALAVNGGIHLGTGDANFQYQLKGLPLRWFNPNLSDVLRATIDDGLVQTKGAVALTKFAPTQINSSGVIADFSVTVHDTENAITRWKSVRWNDLSIDLPQQNVSLKALAINGYSGRLHIQSDGTINMQRLLRESADNNAAEAIEPEAKAETPQAPWTFSIPSIALADSELDFMDESLPIHFRTTIGDLNGNIINLSSDPAASATVNLEGSVDGYAPVSLHGTASLFKDAPELGLKLSFKGVDIAGLTPYSGTYAGYALDRGVLNLDLSYTLKDSHIVGANTIVIEQLKLGEKVASDQAVDLPLGLAIALLSDSNGVIDIDLPIKGNLDNPEFSIGGIVFSTLTKLITKAVTAPFSLLAGLVSSNDDLQRINFEYGSAELSERSIAKLGDISAALQQRPKLFLTISGRLEVKRDTRMLARKMLDQSLLTKGISAADISQKADLWQDAISALYLQLDNSSQPVEVDAQLQYERLVDSITVAPKQLETLSLERAAAVKRYLVTQTNIAADRAVIESAAIDDAANVFSGAELGLSN